MLPLIQTLEDKASLVRQAAIRALRQMGDPRATDALIRILAPLKKGE